MPCNLGPPRLSCLYQRTYHPTTRTLATHTISPGAPQTLRKPTYDSLYINDEGVVYLFQITINERHTIKDTGLDVLATTLDKDLLPWALSKKPWRFVFVTPSDIAKDYKSKSITKCKKDAFAWSTQTYLHQYVLALDGRTVRQFLNSFALLT